VVAAHAHPLVVATVTLPVPPPAFSVAFVGVRV
jgi:hypothetical protein